MGKINLCVLDGDVRYMENFAAYVTGYYRHRFNMTTFSERGGFLEHVQRKDAAADILLIATDMYGEWVSKLESGLVILLAGGGPSAVEDVARVDKYRGADKLVGDILRVYSERGEPQRDADGVRGGRDGKIVLMQSPEGGVGRTSVAIALCGHFARRKLRTLYLNLDWTGVEEAAFGDCAGDGLSDIIYAAKARPERLALKLEAHCRPARGCGFFYYNPPLYPMDVDELEPADIELLIAKFRNIGIFDRIVIDSHNGLSVRNMTLMEHADHALIVARRGETGRRKLIAMKEQLDKRLAERAPDLYKRVQLLINGARDMGERANGVYADGACANGVYAAGAYADGTRLSEGFAELSELFGAKVSALPFCAEIHDVYRADALSNISHGFGATLAEVAHRL